MTFVQTEPAAVTRGNAGWGERRSSGEHAVGNSDVPVWEEGGHPIHGKRAAG